jgi:hypothetical protein
MKDYIASIKPDGWRPPTDPTEAEAGAEAEAASGDMYTLYHLWSSMDADGYDNLDKWTPVRNTTTFRWCTDFNIHRPDLKWLAPVSLPTADTRPKEIGEIQYEKRDEVAAAKKRARDAKAKTDEKKNAKNANIMKEVQEARAQVLGSDVESDSESSSDSNSDSDSESDRDRDSESDRDRDRDRDLAVADDAEAEEGVTVHHEAWQGIVNDPTVDTTTQPATAGTGNPALWSATQAEGRRRKENERKQKQNLEAEEEALKKTEQQRLKKQKQRARKAKEKKQREDAKSAATKKATEDARAEQRQQARERRESSRRDVDFDEQAIAMSELEKQMNGNGGGSSKSEGGARTRRMRRPRVVARHTRRRVGRSRHRARAAHS